MSIHARLVVSLLTPPDSLVSSHVYEIIKTIYSTTATDASEETRVSVIQSTLGQLRLANIATLDAITTHFTRLIELTSADEAYVAALAQTLSPCILRPRQESSLTMNERYSYRLIRDLFAHKDAIFGELKRASTLSHSSSGAARPRAISTDESNRRANYEERNRAIAAVRSPRATSPAPGSRAHRRDRSSTGAETRFPVHTSPTDRRGNTTRNSLEVPGSVENSPIIDGKGTTNGYTAGQGATEDGTSNNVTTSTPASTRVPFPRKHAGSLTRERDAMGKRDSIGSLGSLRETDSPRGVQLEDKPMDD